MKRILITGLCMMFGGSVFGNDVPPLPSNPEKTQSSEVACSPVANGEDSAARLPQNEQSPNDTSVDALKQEQRRIYDDDDYDDDDDDDDYLSEKSYWIWRDDIKDTLSKWEKEKSKWEEENDNIGTIRERLRKIANEIEHYESSICLLEKSIKYCTESIPFMQTQLSFYRANPNPETQFGDAIITRWLEEQLAIHTTAIPCAQSDIKLYNEKLSELRQERSKLRDKGKKMILLGAVKSTDKKIKETQDGQAKLRTMRWIMRCWYMDDAWLV